MKKQAIVKTAVVFTMITMAGTAFAMDKAVKNGHGMNSANHTQIYAQEWAELTDDQRSGLNALHQQFTDETATARASIIAKYEEIKILMGTTSPDKAKLKALSNELAELQKQVAAKEIDLALEAKKIAPTINIPMGFLGAGKHGMMGNGMKCGMGGKGMSMMGKGMGMMGKMNRSAVSGEVDTTQLHKREIQPALNNYQSI